MHRAAVPARARRGLLRPLPAMDLPFLVLGYLMKVVMFRLRGFGGYYGHHVDYVCQRMDKL